MDRRLIWAFAAALMAASPIAAAEAPPSEATEAEGELIGGAFILVDQNGNSVSDEDFRGSYLLLAFGYTHCPDICPTTLMTMASALHLMGAQAKAIRPAFITLDPERDTPARMKDYVESFGPNFLGLTGPQAYIDSVAAKYRIKAVKTPGAGGDYAIDHTAGLFLIGPGGEFLKRFPHDLTAKDLAQRLRETMAATSD